MVKKLKQVAALIITVIVFLSFFGCVIKSDEKGENRTAIENETTQFITVPGETAGGKELVTLKWFGSMVNKTLTGNIQKDPVMKEITKKTGVTLDFEPFLGGDFMAKASVLIAGGDLPDVFVFGFAELRSKLLAAKAIIPLDELIKTNGHNILKNCGYALKLSRLLRSGEEQDKLYFIPGGVNTSDFDPVLQHNTWNLRWDLYKKLNKPRLETLDDLLVVLKRMQELEPVNKDGKKNYGLGLFFSEGWGSWVLDKATANCRGLQAVGSYTIYRDVEKDILIPRLTDPGNIFWQSVKFYNKAYQMGILDPESATMKFQNVVDKGKEGRYFTATANWILGGVDHAFVAEGHPEKGYAPFLINAKNEYMYLVALSEGGNQFNFCITKKCKTPESAMDVFDFLATCEAAELIYNGVEGQTWNMVKGMPKLTDDFIKRYGNDKDFGDKTGVNKYNNLLIFSPLKDSRGFFTRFKNNPGNIEKLMTEAQKDFCKEKGIAYPTEFISKIQNHEFSTSLLQSIQPPTGSDIAAAEARIGAYVEGSSARVVFARNDDEFEKEKVKFIEDVKAMGADMVLEFNRQKYEEMKSKVESVR